MSASATAQSPVSELLPYESTLPKQRFEQAEVLIATAFVGDIAMIAGGLVLGFWIRFRSGWINWGNEPVGLMFRDYSGLIGLGAFFLVLTFAYQQLYTLRRIVQFRESALVIFKGTMFWLFAFLGVNLVLKFQPTISRIYIFSSYLSCLAAILVWRWLFQRLLSSEAIHKALRQRILFVGWTEEAKRLSSVVGKNSSHLYEVAGWIPAPLSRRSSGEAPDVPELGNCSELPSLLKRHNVDM